MEHVTLGEWHLLCDPEATRRSYARIDVGGPEQCGCRFCRNFAEARPLIYQGDVRALLDRLAIDPRREAEVYYQVKLPNGSHQYEGWFHFVGSIAPGGVPAITPEFAVSERFFVYFHSEVALVRGPFKDLPLVQLEFRAQVPWVLNEPEPC